MANELGTIGNQFQVGDGADPEVFSTIGGIVSVPDVGGGEADQIDITQLLDLQRRYLKGYKTPPTVAIPVNIEKGSALLLQLKEDDNAPAKVVRNYRVTEPDGTTVILSMTAYVNGFTIAQEGGDAVRGTVSMTLEDTPVFEVLGETP